MKFDNFFSTYNRYADVQKIVAAKTASFFSPLSNFSSVLEIGCGTGIYTRELIKKIKYEQLTLNDIFYTEGYLSDIPDFQFIQEDMDSLEVKKYSLITSSSAFQWSKDLKELLKKFSAAGENMIFSIYVEENLKEIENHFGISLKYTSTMEISGILKKYFTQVEHITEEIELEFETPMDALRHLKYTGVTGIEKRVSVKKIRSFNSKTLTYRVSYFSCKK